MAQALLLGISMLACQQASSQQTRRVTVMPEYISQLLSGIENRSGIFDTPQAAFAAYQHYLANNCTAPYHCEVSNFRRGENGDFYWGMRLAWWHDYVTTVNGQLYSSGTTGVVSDSLICPDGWQINMNLKSGTGTASDPRYFETYCYQDIPRQQCPEGSCHGQGDPIFPEDGTYRLSDVDYVDPRGVLSFERHYNSSQRSMGSTPSSGVLPLNTNPGQGSLGYTGNATFWDQYKGSNRTIVRTFRYINIPGVTGTVTANQIQVARPGGLFYDYNWDGATATPASPSTHDVLRFNPQAPTSGSTGAASGGQWSLRRALTDATERYDANGVLQQIQYRNGQTKTLTYSDGTTPATIAPGPGYLIGITDGFGKALSMRYDSYGRLATLIDPVGQTVTYGYEPVRSDWNCVTSSCFRVKTVTYQDGQTRTYNWDEPDFSANATNQRNLLTGVTDENGQRYSTIHYDRNGLATSTELAGGVLHYAFVNMQPRTAATVVDPLGTQRTFNFVNAAGLTQLSSLTGAPCDACGPALATFDSNGNVASQTDFNGSVTCFGYDLTRNLETVRIEGLPAGTACPSSLDSYALPAGARKISTQWHPVWRQPIQVAAPKQITIYFFNGDGGQYCAPTGAKVDDTPIGVLCSQTEQPTTDANGSQGFNASAAGAARTTQWTYDGDGQVLSAKGPRTDINSQVSFAYRQADDTATPPQFRRGDLYSVTDVLGHVTTIDQTDPNGRPLRMTDANGTVTTLTYAPRGWLTSRTVTSAVAASQTTRFDYDAVGQLTQVTQPDDSSISFTFDGAHRITGAADSLGNSIAYTLDAMGIRTQEQVKDPNGNLARQITRTFDSINRTVKVTVGSAP